MTEKFKIYCDFQAPKDTTIQLNEAQGNSSKQRPLQTTKREPLGLRQTSEQQAAAIAAAASALDDTSSQSASSSQQSAIIVQNHQLTQREHYVTNNTDEDQENDISMASLGSDFVPSIMHESDQYNDESFGLESEESFAQSEGPLALSEPSELTVGNDYTIEDTDMLDDADLQDEYDEELERELSQAFKRHDDSQLFKAVTFINHIDSYMKNMERIPELRPLPNYMDFQKDIDSDKRTILVNWLIDVSEEYRLQTETLFICINIIDRFLSSMSLTTANLQLLGVAAMFIASKYEEIYPPHLYQFVEVTDDSYSGQQICHMEQLILKTLQFRISTPTATFFLRQIFAYHKFPKKVYDLAEYLCYLTLLVDQPFLEYMPSEIALASVILAANQLDAEDNIDIDLMNAYNQSNQDQLARRELPKGVEKRDIDRRQYTVNSDLPFCIESLTIIQEHAYRRSSKVIKDSSLVEMFSKESRNCVSLLAPPQEELRSELFG